jgi:hypothetical protein
MRTSCRIGAPCRRWTALTLLTLVTSCAEPTSQSTADSSEQVIVPPRVQRVRPTSDDIFARIAGKAPGFGGFYFDGDSLVILLARANQRAVAEQAVQALTAGDRRVSRAPQRIREVRYTFLELVAGRKKLESLPHVRGIRAFGIDERMNRVAIFIDEEGARGRVVRAVEDARIAQDMVDIRIAPRIVPQLTLRDRVRPVTGGVQISFLRGGFEYGCTLGFTARTPAGQDSYVIASHCTPVEGGSDFADIYQHRNAGASYVIGREDLDPVYRPSIVGCPTGLLCRWSDAALVRRNAGQAWAYATIAQTSKSNNDRISTQQSITLVPSRWDVIEEVGVPYVGLFLHKVSRTTGWTSGYVNFTCLTWYLPGNRALLCQDLVNYYNGDGDSGAPVFQVEEARIVYLAGIHWGGDGSSTGILSSLSNIEEDLGDLRVTF